MKRITGLLLTCALALAGCATVVWERAGRLPDDGGFDLDKVSRPKATLPNVFVQGGHLIVDQEPIRLWRRDVDSTGSVVIAWALPARSAARWPAVDKAVSFKPRPPKLDCKVPPSGKILSCSFVYVSLAQYKYTLTAVDNDISTQPLDPYIVNME
jgi:hypothetical protein